MKVKLLTTVSGIGRSGEIVQVSDAQARNFLIPKKLAVLATGAVLRAQERDRAHEHQQQSERRATLANLAQRLGGQSLHIIGKASEQGKLFAAVKTSDVQTALERQFGVKLSGLTIQPDHFKTVGTHQVQITLDQDHQATITIVIDHAS